MVMNPSTPHITVRWATQHDEAALRRLAFLDSARPVAGPALVASRDGELLAALPLRSREPIADPFAPTGDLVELLELRAVQMADSNVHELPRHTARLGRLAVRGR